MASFSTVQESSILFTIFQWIFLFVVIGVCSVSMIFRGRRLEVRYIDRWGNAGKVNNTIVPAHEGLLYHPLQYCFDMKNVKEIVSITFTLNLSSYGHAFLRQSSALTPMDEEKKRQTSICTSVLGSFDYTIDSLRKSLSCNGKTFHDPKHPVLLKFEYLAWSGIVYYTSFLIYHANAYVCCFRAANRWRHFSDSAYELIDENKCRSQSLNLISSYNKGCYDFVGVCTIIKALKDLNTDFGKDSFRSWKDACLHLVYCFIEATRFRDIERFVREALEESCKGDPYISKTPTNELCKVLVNSWGTLSDALLKYDETGEFNLSEDEKEKFLITGDTAEEQVAFARYMVALRLR